MKSEAILNSCALPNRARRCALAVAALLSIALLLFPVAAAAILGIAVAFFLLIALADRILSGRAETLLLMWVLVYPLGYYFLSFPQEKAVITFDRTVVILVVVAAACAPIHAYSPVPRTLRISAIAWAVFVAVATASLFKTGSVDGALTGAHIVVDSFILPALLAWYVIRQFPARRCVPLLHALVCVSCVYLAGIGAVELYTGKDLLPLPGAVDYFAGAGELALIRVNGPFSSNNSYALIGMVSLWFLLFLRRQIKSPGRGRRVLHALGTASATLVAVLPLFRSVILTLIALAIAYAWLFLRGKRRLALVTAVIILLGLSGAVISIYLPSVYLDRTSDSSNIFARFGQQRQNLEMFLRDPVLGTGVGNFLKSAPPSTPYWGLFAGLDPADAPHNALADVLVETGFIGFVPFAVASLLFLVAFFRVRSSSPEGREAWLFFCFIGLTYWSTGMTEAIELSSDLNLWYMFSLAFIYRFWFESIPQSIEPVARLKELPA